MKKKPTDTISGVSSDAVKQATGKSWDQWLKALDKVGARKWPRKQTVDFLSERHGLAGRWAQTVAAGFEHAFGLHAKRRELGGFEISVSRTIAAPVAQAFEAWKNPLIREQWMPHTPLTIRKATPHKSIRILWSDGTGVSVNFWPKGPLKCEIVPEHDRLPDAETADRLKLYWAKKLDELKEYLEKR